MNSNLFKLLINTYPPYWGTGISIKHISRDYSRITVRMKMRWYNRNYVGTHFGGSLYSMTDPFYMLMLMHILGNEYQIWDRSAEIDFIKPGKGTVTALFHVDTALIEDIKKKTAGGEKYLPQLQVEIKDESGEIIARVKKTIYVRRTKYSRP